MQKNRGDSTSLLRKKLNMIPFHQFSYYLKINISRYRNKAHKLGKIDN